MNVVADAVNRLVEAPNYSWTRSTKSAVNDLPPSSIEGATERGGFTVRTELIGDQAIQSVRKGSVYFVRQLSDGSWQTAAERRAIVGASGSGIFGAGGARKNPDEELTELMTQIEEYEAADGFISASLTEGGVAAHFNFGGKVPIKNLAGSARFWIRDGMISKYEIHLKATLTVRGEDQEIDNTITVTLKSIGSSKVNVPEEALRKLGLDTPRVSQ